VATQRRRPFLFVCTPHRFPCPLSRRSPETVVEAPLVIRDDPTGAFEPGNARWRVAAGIDGGDCPRGHDDAIRYRGSTTTRGRHVSRDSDIGRVAFCGTENISTPNLSYAAQYLARGPPVNASRRPSRDAAHHSGSGRMASPYPVGDFHLLFFASFPGALRSGRVEDGRGSLGHSATLRFPSHRRVCQDTA
jgi:hypothetical protein